MLLRLPCVADQHASCTGLSKSKMLGKFFYGGSVTAHLTSKVNRFPRHLCFIVTLSFDPTGPTLPHHIQDIVNNGPHVKVRRVKTDWPIAVMKSTDAFIQGAVGDVLHSRTRDESHFTAKIHRHSDLTVSIGVETERPIKAWIRGPWLTRIVVQASKAIDQPLMALREFCGKIITVHPSPLHWGVCYRPQWCFSTLGPLLYSTPSACGLVDSHA